MRAGATPIFIWFPGCVKRACTAVKSPTWPPHRISGWKHQGIQRPHRLFGPDIGGCSHKRKCQELNGKMQDVLSAYCLYSAFSMFPQLIPFVCHTFARYLVGVWLNWSYCLDKWCMPLCFDFSRLHVPVQVIPVDQCAKVQRPYLLAASGVPAL